MTVTPPRGFRAAAVTAGLKPSGSPDVALVVNDGPGHAAAAVFTSNRCKANPVLWSEQAVERRALRAVVAQLRWCQLLHGPGGFPDDTPTAEGVAEGLGVAAIDVLVCSTGLIGEPLDADRLLTGIRACVAALSDTGGDAAAEAILTTDTRAKQAVVTRDGWCVAGMAKGAGMLAPALATMLVVMTTDAEVDAGACDRGLRAATGVSFDRLDSDGCMSTNDTVVLMSSAASQVRPTDQEFADAVRELSLDLAAQLIGDAEGADHEIAVTVVNAATEADAVEVARAIARSALFKAAVFGKDPNWGRILAAVGTTAAAFDPTDLDVAMNGVWICRNGEPGEPRELVDLTGRSVTVTVDLKSGVGSATVWTTDLTHAYVHENSAYST